MALNPPELLSEHGAGQVTVKAHTRKAPPKAAPKGKGRTASAATGVPPPSNPVDDQVAAAQLPQIQAIKDAQDASALAAKNSAATVQGYYNALAGMLQGIGPQVQAGYSSAAGNDAAFGKGFSDGLAHVQSQSDAQNTNLAGIAGGQAPPAAGPAASNALYALGGYIPATTLNREGAAFGAAASYLPNTAAGQGASTIAGIGRQQTQDQAGFTKQLSDLAAQVPGLRAQAQSAFDSNQNQVSQLKMQAYQFAVKEQDVHDQQRINYLLATGVDANGHLLPETKAKIAQMQATINQRDRQLAISQQNADTSSQRASVGAVTGLSKVRGYLVDPTGQPILDGNGNLQPIAGYKLGPNGTVVKDPKAGKAPKFVPGQQVVGSVGKMRVQGYTDAEIGAQLKKWHPGWTAAQIAATLKAAPEPFDGMSEKDQRVLQSQVSALRSGWKFAPNAKSSQTITIGGVPYKAGDAIPPISYGAALRFLIQRGYNRTYATAMLNRFWPKGKRR